MGRFVITEEERSSIRRMYLLEQGTTVNQMVGGPITFYRDRIDNDVTEYYIYKQGKTEQEAKFYVYYQDNPTNPKQPDKLTLLDELSHETLDLAKKHVQEKIFLNKGTYAQDFILTDDEKACMDGYFQLYSDRYRFSRDNAKLMFGEDLKEPPYWQPWCTFDIKDRYLGTGRTWGKFEYDADTSVITFQR